jgi:hypothetical protein
MPQNDFFRISLQESKNASYLKTSSRVSDIYSLVGSGSSVPIPLNLLFLRFLLREFGANLQDFVSGIS